MKKNNLKYNNLDLIIKEFYTTFIEKNQIKSITYEGIQVFYYIKIVKKITDITESKLYYYMLNPKYYNNFFKKKITYQSIESFLFS